MPRDYKGEYEALSHALVGDTGASAILTADRIRSLLHRVFVQAARSSRRPDEGCTIYVTPEMIDEARRILGVE